MATENCIRPVLRHAAGRSLKRLAARSLTVVTAESCTAGLIAAALSLGEGASTVLHGSFVTYTNETKARALGVPIKLLRQEGSVTRRVVSDML